MDTVIAPRDERTQPIRVVPGYPQTPWRNPKEPLIRRPPTLSEFSRPFAFAMPRIASTLAERRGLPPAQSAGKPAVPLRRAPCMTV